MSLSLQARAGSIQQDEMTSQERAALGAEEEQQKITSFEEAFRRIKEATGVSDTQVRLAHSEVLQFCRMFFHTNKVVFLLIFLLMYISDILCTRVHVIFFIH